MNDSKHPIVFTGKASEYFGIWIVNLLLSILTLGIYSAWAKVRRKKYFYQNTLIDGVGFDYHANPISILKGRVIAVALFMIYALSQETMPLLSAACLLLFFIALPWIVVRANIFNARNSSHRGLRFNFSGSVLEAVRVFIGLPMLLMFTLGLIYPYISHQRSKFLITGHQFGTSTFKMDAKVGDFYMIYLKTLGVIVASLLVIGGVLAALAGLSFAGHIGNFEAMKGVAVLGAMLVYLLTILVVLAYLQSRIGNLVWNSASIDHVGFASSLRARDMIWIYISNLVAIALSFGLLTPWAQIRMQKYRAEHLTLVGEVDFNQFVADKKAQARATGEEIADMFDVDLAFG